MDAHDKSLQDTTTTISAASPENFINPPVLAARDLKKRLGVRADHSKQHESIIIDLGRRLDVNAARLKNKTTDCICDDRGLEFDIDVLKKDKILNDSDVDVELSNSRKPINVGLRRHLDVNPHRRLDVDLSKDHKPINADLHRRDTAANANVGAQVGPALAKTAELATPHVKSVVAEKIAASMIMLNLDDKDDGREEGKNLKKSSNEKGSHGKDKNSDGKESAEGNEKSDEKHVN
ncbi:hypothetical protein BGZ51_007138 [Haplosporangium sp. Z 767]|nr:hypothetical protein BGZ51_007138 [Haplosporangium sp. Z 767]KAF9192587.1 hypothetical protein BGZ50_008418 [Haplosporangium sp. Z 11]